jgi:2-methylisocitrate lyase-like PEP mutase family enzyme
MPGAFDVLSALIFQQMGFPAVQASSAGIANALGYADLAVGRDRTVSMTREIAGALTVPLNADGEDGFGGPGSVAETVHLFLEAGAAGMNMEDSVHGDARALVPIPDQLDKIAAFNAARREIGSDFVLNARVDAYGVIRDDPGAALKEAVRRGQTYAEAGADCVFFLAVSDREAIRTLVNEVPAPISVFGLPGGPDVPELQELGVARVSFGGAFLRAAAGAVKRLAETIRTQGRLGMLDEALSTEELRAALGGRVRD